MSWVGDGEEYSGVEWRKYLTDEEVADVERYNMHTFDEEAAEQEKLVRISLSLLKVEMARIEGHLEHADHNSECRDGEWESIVYHLDNVCNGVSLMFGAILTHLIPSETSRILTELAAMKASVETGTPFEAVEVTRGVWGIREEKVEMPDDLSGLDGGMG